MDGQWNGSSLDKRAIKRPVSLCGWALLALLLIAQLGGVAIVYAIGRVSPAMLRSPTALWLINAFIIYVLGFPVFALILKRVPVVSEEPREQKPTAGELGKLLVICFALAYLSNLVTQLVLFLIGRGGLSVGANPLDNMVGQSSLLGNLVFLGILAPVMEEIMFRGLLVSRLRGLGDRFCIFFTALAFALFHCNFYQFLYAFAVGAVLAYTAIRFGSIKYSIFLHVCFNLVGGVLLPFLLTLGQEGLIMLAGFMVIVLIIWGAVLMYRNWGLYEARQGEESMSTGQKIALMVQTPGTLAFLVFSLAIGVYTLVA